MQSWADKRPADIRIRYPSSRLLRLLQRCSSSHSSVPSHLRPPADSPNRRRVPSHLHLHLHFTFATAQLHLATSALHETLLDLPYRPLRRHHWASFALPLPIMATDYEYVKKMTPAEYSFPTQRLRRTCEPGRTPLVLVACGSCTTSSPSASLDRRRGVEKKDEGKWDEMQSMRYN